MQSFTAITTSEEANDTIQPLLHEYFRNGYYKTAIALALILFFSILFNLIYLVIDSLLDKQKHYNHALKLAERYQTAKSRRESTTKHLECKDSYQNYEINKVTYHIEYSVWTYRNLQISFIHSSLCSIWLVRILISQHSELFADLLFYKSWDTYLIAAFSCGYFVYDLYDIYANGYHKVEWVILVHHVIVLVSFGYNMINFISIGYTVCALFMEFNSVFLHARKLLKFYGYNNTHPLVRINKLLNFLTFIVFRFGTLALLYSAIYSDGLRIALPYLVLLVVCIIIMTVINVNLFKRLLMTDVFSTCNKRNQHKLVVGGLDDVEANRDAQMKLLEI